MARIERAQLALHAFALGLGAFLVTAVKAGAPTCRTPGRPSVGHDEAQLLGARHV